MAVVVQAQNAANVGLIVRVCGPYAEEANFAYKGVLWLCECAHPMTWVRGGRTISALRGPIPDMLLQPIRGLSRPAAQTAHALDHSVGSSER